MNIDHAAYHEMSYIIEKNVALNQSFLSLYLSFAIFYVSVSQLLT